MFALFHDLGHWCVARDKFPSLVKEQVQAIKEQVHVPTCSEKEPNKEEEERSVIDEWSSEEEIED